MPSDAARMREDQVVDLVCEALSGSGREVSVVRRPDREASDESGLTVDALLKVTSEGVETVWAADVCLVPFMTHMASADERLRRDLEPILDEIVTEVGYRVGVAVTPVVDAEPKTRNQRHTAYVKHVAACVRDAVNKGPGHYRYDDGVTVDLATRPPSAAEPRSAIYTWVSGPTADVAAQLRRDLQPVVERKLNGQFANARAQGMPTVLILDQRGAADLPVPPNQIATAFSIRPLMAQLADVDGSPVLDAVVLVNPDDQISEIFGTVGVPRS